MPNWAQCLVAKGAVRRKREQNDQYNLVASFEKIVMEVYVLPNQEA